MSEIKKKTLTVVGIGPGNAGDITYRARRALEEAEAVVGYPVYIDQLKGMDSALLQNKELFTSGMRREIERVTRAVEEALKGKKVCLVSGGDAGVYGLAGLALEMVTEESGAGDIAVEVIPGVTAATAAAARLGAPLIHDFTVISLSDLLTDKNKIVTRLQLAAEGDFVTVIYNPRSSRRKELFSMVPEIFLENRSGTTPVGIVHHAGREDENVILTTLAELKKHEDEIHMGTTVIIGNSESKTVSGFFITPRGYRLKESG